MIGVFWNVDGNSERLLAPDNLEFLIFGISCSRVTPFGCMGKILANLWKNNLFGGGEKCFKKVWYACSKWWAIRIAKCICYLGHKAKTGIVKPSGEVPASISKCILNGIWFDVFEVEQSLWEAKKLQNDQRPTWLTHAQNNSMYKSFNLFQTNWTYHHKFMAFLKLPEVTISPSNRTTKSSGVDPNGLVST